MRITLKTITQEGQKILKQTIQENDEQFKTYTPEQRKAFLNTWKEIKTQTSYTLLLKARSGLGASYYITKRFTRSVNSAKEFNKDLQIEFDKMRNEIETTMQKNGATKDIDYYTEVVQ